MESSKYKQFQIGWAMMEDISEDAADGWTQNYNEMQLGSQPEEGNLEAVGVMVPEASDSEVICLILCNLTLD